MTNTSGDSEFDVRPRLAAGRAPFMGLELLCGPGALVPRPETELLARTAIDMLKARGPEPVRVVDVCCGAGNLACAIAMHVPTARVWATDISAPAVKWARRNAEALELTDRVTVTEGDLFEPLASDGLAGTVDLIVCNPPYISTGRLTTTRAALLEHEPREAFDGGPYGMSVHQRVLREGAPLLRSDGAVMVEFGLAQHDAVRFTFGRARAYGDVTLVPDAAGHPRVAVARLRDRA